MSNITIRHNHCVICKRPCKINSNYCWKHIDNRKIEPSDKIDENWYLALGFAMATLDGIVDDRYPDASERLKEIFEYLKKRDF